jgi:hypothetical protein
LSGNPLRDALVRVNDTRGHRHPSPQLTRHELATRQHWDYPASSGTPVLLVRFGRLQQTKGEQAERPAGRPTQHGY